MAKRSDQSSSYEEDTENESSRDATYDVMTVSSKGATTETCDSMGQWRGGKADGGDDDINATPSKMVSTESDHASSNPSRLKSHEFVTGAAGNRGKATENRTSSLTK